MAISSYFQQKLLEHVTGVGAYTMPDNHELGLFFQSSPPSGPITEISTSGTGYARKAITFAAQISGELYANTAAVTFECSGVDYGAVNRYGVFDGGGNLLWHERIHPAVFIGNDDTYTVAAGQVRISL